MPKTMTRKQHGSGKPSPKNRPDKLPDLFLDACFQPGRLDQNAKMRPINWIIFGVDSIILRASIFCAVKMGCGFCRHAHIFYIPVRRGRTSFRISNFLYMQHHWMFIIAFRVERIIGNRLQPESFYQKICWRKRRKNSFLFRLYRRPG